MSPEMKAALDAFKLQLPSGCSVRPQSSKPHYTLVTIEGWPHTVHYEFRDCTCCRDLYIEIHIEDAAYKSLQEVLRAIVVRTPKIGKFELRYFETRPWPHQKKWPSVSISVPKDQEGRVAASVMGSLIASSRTELEAALNNVNTT